MQVSAFHKSEVRAEGFWERASGGQLCVHAALRLVKRWAFDRQQAVLCGEFVILLTCCGSGVTSGPTVLPIIGNIYFDILITSFALLLNICT